MPRAPVLGCSLEPTLALTLRECGYTLTWQLLSTQWVASNMDIPVPDWCLPMQGERATGYGVALLTTLYGSRSASPLLQASAPFFHCEEKYRQMKEAQAAKES